MKYKYYSGQALVCTSSTKVTFTDSYPSIREEVEGSPKTPIKNKDDAEDTVVTVEKE